MAEEMDRATLYVDALQCGIAAWWKIWGDPLLSQSDHLQLAGRLLHDTAAGTGVRSW